MTKKIGWAFLFIILVVFAYLLFRKTEWKGGGARLLRKRRVGPTSDHVVVDTLNLAHWVGATPISIDNVIKTIDYLTPILRKTYPGRIIFTLKDPTVGFFGVDEHGKLKAAADRNRVYIYVAEKYRDPPRETKKIDLAEHSTKGRDDFYMSLLADRYQAVVLSGDKLGDFEKFRSSIPAFQVWEFNYWKELPTMDYIRPEADAFKKIKRPFRLSPARTVPQSQK